MGEMHLRLRGQPVGRAEATQLPERHRMKRGNSDRRWTAVSGSQDVPLPRPAGAALSPRTPLLPCTLMLH